ncbi:thiol-activated cytolysin family protein [Riemerella anatipestifer]|uniref:thiol-activated cytolysin family protein n=1 Tax=Riemerella anatipestifer TaxID=34085 RepID=UPI0030BBA8A2
MKKVRFLSLGLVLFSLLSCREEGNVSTSKSINDLETVKFLDQSPKVLSSTKTGYTRYNPSTSSTEFEYLNVVEKTHTLSPLSFVDAKNTDVIYPGSILRGASFVQGSYDPLVPKVDFNDVKISISLRGKDLPVKEVCKPILSEVRNVTNTLLAKYKNEIDYSFVPAYVSYQADKVNTSSSFNKSFNLHANANVLGGVVSAKFNYQDSYNSSNSKNYVMVKLHQNFYSVSIDPKHYSEWFKGEVDAKEYGTHEPVYVSNVDYGRVAYLLIETSQSEEETKKMVSGAVNFAFGKVSGGVESSYNQSFRKLFSESKIRVLIAGGPAKLAGQVDTYDSFIEFIKTPDIDALISSAAPISYKIRRLKDNTEVEVKTILTEKELQYKKD